MWIRAKNLYHMYHPVVMIRIITSFSFFYTNTSSFLEKMRLPFTSLSLLAISHVAADYTNFVDPNNYFGKWKGFGTSLAWWAKNFGDRSDIADALFTLQENVTVGDINIPGLGLNVLRYNIGGSGKGMIKSFLMPEYKEVETFWIDGKSDDPTTSSWDWSVDQLQREMLVAAKERGVDTFEAFSNSPPWWMTKTQSSAGGIWFDPDNLKDGYHEKFAIYLATVVEHAKENWGIEFNWIQPANEPAAFWWNYPYLQEGCRLSVETQLDVITHLRKHLDKRGLENVKIAAFDDNSPGEALASLQKATKLKNGLDFVDKVNTHGYFLLFPYRGSARPALRDTARQANVTLWSSEYGDSDIGGLTLAESIGLDFNEIQADVWAYWLAVDEGSWGLIDVNYAQKTIQGLNDKYYVMAHYTRHIRPGMLVISSPNDKKSVIAYDRENCVLVVVTVNTKGSQNATFDLSKFQSIKGPVTLWKTDTRGGGDLYSKYFLVDQVVNRTLTVQLETKSVYTIEVQGVIM
jgi:galactan endo-1,6-beta-galactosidase